MDGERTLQTLVEASVAGDPASFRMLTVALERKLFSYLRSRTNTREEAIDTLQDVLVDVWQALPSFEYRSEEGFYRFVFTIAKRRLFRLRIRPATLPLEAADALADASLVQEGHERVVVAQALKTLDQLARDIVTLRHWSGFSFKEIAGVLAMKEEAVRVRHHRALAKLRSTLSPYVT